MHFPGGIARIDETRVWSLLSAWIHRNEARGASCLFTRAPQSDQDVCVLELHAAPDLEHTKWEARSRLSIADAVANALQAAESEGT